MTEGTTLANVVASEWTKLRSVRSTLWTSASTFFVTVGLSALVCWGFAGAQNGSAPRVVDATGLSLAGITMGQLAIVVLGVMVIASEYTSGGIRTTFTAVPQRLKVVGAKALVLGAVALVVGLATSVVAFALGQLFFGRAGLGASLSDPGVARAVFGGGLYLAATALFGFALGTLLRTTAGAITVAVGALLVLPFITGVLPGEWGAAINRYLPSNAGRRIMEVGTSSPGLGPWTGFLVFCLWSAVIAGVGAVLIQRRDA